MTTSTKCSFMTLMHLMHSNQVQVLSVHMGLDTNIIAIVYDFVINTYCSWLLQKLIKRKILWLQEKVQFTEFFEVS